MTYSKQFAFAVIVWIIGTIAAIGLRKYWRRCIKRRNAELIGRIYVESLEIFEGSEGDK